MSYGPTEERVVYRERFQAVRFDFRGKSIFTRYDGCEFVKCTLLIDHATEQLVFTDCIFRDYNMAAQMATGTPDQAMLKETMLRYGLIPVAPS